MQTVSHAFFRVQTSGGKMRQVSSWLLLVVYITFNFPFVLNQSPQKQLGRYNVEPLITVSGISGGGSFSMMISFIFSSFIKGAGIFAGGPMPIGLLFWINPVNALRFRAYTEMIDRLAWAGLIDDTANLRRNSGGYVYHGIFDPVPVFLSQTNLKLFQHYGVKRVKNMIKKIPSSHCIPINLTKEINYPCLLGVEALCGCGYPGVADAFSVILSEDNYRVPTDDPPTGTVFRIDQNEFFPNSDAASYSWNSFGFMYVPKRCEPETGIMCKLHFAFHGCGQTLISLYMGWDPAMVTDGGYKEVADANDVIVIFPQTQLRVLSSLSIGCFDLYGYTSGFGANFTTRFGIQPIAFRKMYERVAFGK